MRHCNISKHIKLISACRPWQFWGRCHLKTKKLQSLFSSTHICDMWGGGWEKWWWTVICWDLGGQNRDWTFSQSVRNFFISCGRKLFAINFPVSSPSQQLNRSKWKMIRHWIKSLDENFWRNFFSYTGWARKSSHFWKFIEQRLLHRFESFKF